MRLASYLHEGRPGWGAIDGERIKPLDAAWPDLRSALAAGIADIAARAAEAEATIDLDAVTLLPPVPNPEKILAIGVNYRSHSAETGRAIAEHPAIFVRFPDAQVGSGQPIVRPFLSEKFDFEAELAVVMGRAGRHIRVEDALGHVAGYACFADNALRDFQRHTNQATPGKNFDASGAFGPWLVTADEIGDPARLTLTGRLNGEQVQHSSVGNLIFSVPELIAYISSFTTLKPGDVIATGTPSGVGMKRTPPLFMRAGDVFEVEISGIGILRNQVIDEPAPTDAAASPAIAGAE
jgi:2-keto-4-pentenoate hydratase/2-oxohepta-3-ene-1,7-dioic acid hydratase in catechol pathway